MYYPIFFVCLVFFLLFLLFSFVCFSLSVVEGFFFFLILVFFFLHWWMVWFNLIKQQRITFAWPNVSGVIFTLLRSQSTHAHLKNCFYLSRLAISLRIRKSKLIYDKYFQSCILVKSVKMCRFYWSAQAKSFKCDLHLSHTSPNYFIS